MKRAMIALAVMTCFCIGGMSQNSGVSPSVAAGPGGAIQAKNNLLPPSPEAFSFTRYGNLDIGLHTGTFQYSLPVYTMTARGVSHGISINYSTNGVKVDEMASRVGLQWQLSAGGVITRTVRDKIDELNTKHYTHTNPANYNSSTFYNYIADAANNNYDLEPDEYNVNAGELSGKFYQREDGSFVFINTSKVKVERRSIGSNIYGFTITGTNGNMYFFDQYDFSTQVQNNMSTSLEQQPLSGQNAWYLTKIRTPDNDSLVFTYTQHAEGIQLLNGISQSAGLVLENGFGAMQTYMYRGFDGGFMEGPASVSPAPPGITTNISETSVATGYLSAISNGEATLQFKYSSRDDVPGEVKLDTILLRRNSDSVVIKKWKLAYTYSTAGSTYATNTGTAQSPAWLQSTYPALNKRLFLSAFSQLTDTGTSGTYRFMYEDSSGLPPRLSFAQDRFGYFNGQSNLYFFPKNTWLQAYNNIENFGGDREFDFTYARKGVLKTIIYPTGGRTDVVYEAHQTWQEPMGYKSTIPVTLNIDTSTTVNQVFQSGSFSHDGGKLKFSYACNWASVPQYDPLAESSFFVTAALIDTVTNTCVSLCDPVINAGDTGVYYFPPELAAGTYKLRLTASKASIRFSGSLTSFKWRTDSLQVLTGIGGCRVKSISDDDGIAKYNKRSFLYRDWNDTASCSGAGIFQDLMLSNHVSAVRLIASQSVSNSCAGYTSPCGIYAGYNTINSNSSCDQYYPENNTVFYSKVIEWHTDSSGNNGGIEYQFSTPAALNFVPQPLSHTQPQNVWDFSPVLIPGVPFSTMDFLGSKLLSKKVFMAAAPGATRTILQESKNYYSVQSAYSNTDTFYAVRKVIDRTGSINSSWNYFYDYDINRYVKKTAWVTLDSTRETSYAGSSALSQGMTYIYNADNLLPREIRTVNSMGDTLYNKTLYSADYASAPVYSVLVQRNQLAVPVVETKENASGELLRVSAQYGLAQPGNQLYKLLQVDKQIAAGTTATELENQLFDSKGNIVQYKGKDELVKAVIWDYDARYPIAEATNALYGDVATTSFEGNANGGFSLTAGSIAIDTTAPTGKKAYALSGGAVSRASLNTGKTYIVSYWSKNGAQSVNSSTAVAGKTVGNWTYYEHRVVNPSGGTITVSGSGTIDELRLYPEGAMMTTFTYDPMVGVTSQCDAGNRIMYYEYDVLKRLRIIRDQDKNLVKKICYNYAGETENCN